MRKTTFIISLLFLILASCEKIFIGKDMENTHENNFEILWSTIDTRYSFFEYKNVDWDSLYLVYKPMVSNSITNRRFFNICAEMLFELHDGHVNLYSDFDSSRNWEWYSNYPLNFNFDIVGDNYLEPEYTRGPFTYSVIDNNTGYIYIGSFADEIEEEDIDHVVESLKDLNSIIIDVRNNSGGISYNSKLIASRFADRTRLVSYFLYKSGPGHGDFSVPQPNYVSPGGNNQFTKPVVVLTNRRTYSATNDFVLSMSAFPHVTVMGDATGGGGGTPYEYELLNGWRCRFPQTQTLGINGFNVENGIEPDIRVSLLKIDEERGIDTIIEAALKYIGTTGSEAGVSDRNHTNDAESN